MVPHAALAALASACALTSNHLPETPVIRISAVSADQLELLGFRLGMTPQEVVAAAKAKGLPFQAHQNPLPGGGAYPARVDVDGPTRIRVTFSAVTRAADDIEADSVTAIMPGAGPDPLYEAATAKWGKWTDSDGSFGSADVPKVVWWGNRSVPHAEYYNSSWDQGSPSAVRILDPAAIKASDAALAAPVAPIPHL